MNKKVENAIRSIVPRWLLVGLKRFYIFNRVYGQLQTNQGLLVDGNGQFIPWFTYPAIEFLRNLDFSNDQVFEFGSGASSFFWLDRAKTVHSVEHDRHWYEKMKLETPRHSDRWSLYFESEDASYARAINKPGVKFDVAVVDGMGRRKCTEQAAASLSENGMIIIDNSEWYPASCRYLRDQGFTQIDFSGFAPQNAFTHCTSIFYRQAEAIRSRYKDKQMTWTPLGGRSLAPQGAYDDLN